MTITFAYCVAGCDYPMKAILHLQLPTCINICQCGSTRTAKEQTMQALQAAAVRLTLTIWFLNVSEHFGTCSTDILHHQISIAKHTLRIKLCSCSSKICLCCALSLKAKIQGSFPSYFVKRTCAMHHSTA